VRNTLHRGHAGPIRPFHGSDERDGLYPIDELRGLAASA